MLRVFQPTDKVFDTNGDIVLDATRAVVTKADNGEFFLTLESPIDYSDYLKPSNIVVAPTPTGYQAFRLGEVEATRTKIKAKVKHVYYDSDNYLIADAFVVDKTCNDALDHLNNATDTLSPFTTLSDVDTVNSFRCVRKSLNEAVTTILERWGGHLVRDNFNIQIKENIGVDNGVTVQYKKNLKEISVSYNWANVCTKLLPVGKDGFTLDNLYLYSDVQYDLPYTKTVSFSQDIDKDSYASEEAYLNALTEDLISQGKKYLASSQYPIVNYTLNANLDKITDIGDIIRVYDERLGVDITTRVIAYEYDCISGQYLSVQFGNLQNNLSNLLNSVNNNISKEVEISAQAQGVQLQEAISESESKIYGILGNSYVIYDGSEILVVDSLPAETANNVIRINSAGIGFSQTGITGNFTTAWTIDGTFNAQAINVINFTADMIKGGVLKLGSALNQSGLLELYDEENTLIATMDKNGLKFYALDGSYIVINTVDGFKGYDRNNNPTFWVAKDEFHQKKSVIEEEITLCNKLRFIPIEIYSGSTLVNDGIGLVSVYEQ